MARFLAFVHREGPQFLIFIEGVGEGRARSLREAGRVARAMALRHVLAAYPERGETGESNALQTLRLEVEIVMERPLARGRPVGGEPDTFISVVRMVRRWAELSPEHAERLASAR